MVFRGGPVLALDAKGRVTVPTRWRDQLMATVQGRLVLAKHPDGCLALYPLPQWEKFEAQIMELAGEHDAWRRLYMGSANDVEIDSGSRIHIPQELREWAQLDKQVLFMGVGPHFELWDPARYQGKETVAIAQGRPEPLRGVVPR